MLASLSFSLFRFLWAARQIRAFVELGLTPLTAKGMAMVMTIDRYRIWLTALTVLWVVTAATVVALMRAETVRVHRVEVLNSRGNPVAVLGVSPTDGGVLLIYDANGSLRTAVGLTTQGDVAIDLNDANGHPKVTLQVSGDGSVTVKGLRSK